MKLRVWLMVAVVCLAAVVSNAARPNVLFLAVDDWNDMVGVMGDNQVKSPNLDKLAKRGTVFTNAQIPGVYCAPSRTAIMTGLQPYHSGLYSDEPHMYNIPDHKDIPQYFKANGYQVYGGGKVYHHMQGYLDRRGFDYWYIWNEEHKKKGWRLGSWDEGAPNPPERPWCATAKYTGWEEFDHYEMPNEDEEKMADTMCANWAADFLGQKHDEPFFLAFGTYAPHKPNYVPKKYYDLYPIDKIKLPPVKDDDLDDLAESVQKKLNGRAKRVHNTIVENGDWAAVVRGYFASCSYADAMMGRVLDALEKSPYADNTVVVLWSDNGYHLGEKTKWAKHTLWERTTHVPFIWAGPGVPKGQKLDVTVGLVDTYKTLIELCGLPANKEIEGESLLPIFGNPQGASDRMVITTDHDSYSIVNRDWRYISRPDGEELYDLKKDPNEWTNLAEKPEYKAIKQKMGAVIPKNPVPVGKGPKSKEIRLVYEGEDFRWVPADGKKGGNKKKKGGKKNKQQADATTQSNGLIKTDWCTIRHGDVVKAGQPFNIEIEYRGLKEGLIAGMSLNWHRADGKFGGKLFLFKQLRGVENGKAYTRIAEVGELPEGIGFVKLATTVSATGKFADRIHHVVSEEIPIGK